MGRDILDLPAPAADARFAYGKDPNQFGELRLPKSAGPFPVLVSIHGGFWRASYGLDHMGHACAALAQSGIASWNFEYRRVGQPGGGYPGTQDDGLAALQYLATLAASHPLDLKRVAVFGFSAGGHLALWLASRPRPIALQGAVSLAGVADLRRAWEMRLGSGAVDDYIGGPPAQYPDRYRAASPIELLPGGGKTRLVHGTKDTTVPIEISERFAKGASAAGLDAKLLTLPGADHFPGMDPRDPEWKITEGAILEILGVQRK
ncbi:MAG: alpha/beta hydrolase [Bryobacteraceae bacterium]